MSGKSYALKKSRKPIQTMADKNMWLAVSGGIVLGGGEMIKGHLHVVISCCASLLQPLSPTTTITTTYHTGARTQTHTQTHTHACVRSLARPQEIQALAAVEGHPNIVTYYDSWAEPADGGQGEHMFIKLELCGESLGATLSTVASRHGASPHARALKEPELLEVLRQVSVNL